jgi:23S rRNA (uracil1939-C5)-methyltransferase
MLRFKSLQNISLTQFHSSGKAIGKNKNSNIFVNYGIPGEVVDLKVAKRQKRRFIGGEIEKIIASSDHRVIPFCKHFGNCGGCNWMQIDYNAQLAWKRKIVENAFLKYNIQVQKLPDIIPSPQLQYYRNKLEFAFANKSAENEKPNIYLGFHPIENPFAVLEIDECYLQSSVSVEICKKLVQFLNYEGFTSYNFSTGSGLLRNLIIRTTTTGDCMVIVGFAETDSEATNKIMTFLNSEFAQINSLHYTILTNPKKGYADGEITWFSGKKQIEEKIENLVFKISPKAFYQPNPMQAINVYKKIREYASSFENPFIYDLYTGIGTIAFYLARNAKKIFGIEGSLEAIADAQQNALNNNFENLDFIVGDILETFTTSFVDQKPKPDIIILDPPRSGTLVEIKKAMMYAKPSLIIYVSCNPVSLAWDLKQLTEEYKIVDLSLFDMFPHTHQIETVVLLERKK